MSFAALVRDIPAGGRVNVKGGVTQGHVEKSTENITVEKYKPSVGKGSEYAAKIKAEADKAYFESITSLSHEVKRIDVTEGENSASQLFQPEELTSIGTLPNLRELNREEFTQVYQRYTFSPPEPSEQLQSIHKERDKILSMIELNQVCIIKGPTGCGKSTQIPQFILDSHVERGSHCNIIVTQPRRIAAIAIAQHICEERNWEVGGIVGYQVGLDKTVSEDTRLLYCTTGVLLEKLISAKHMNDYTHVLLDEVHEREEDMDFTLLIVKRLLRLNSPNVKVVLMSATMDVSRFAKYFEVILRNERQLAPFYEIKRESKFTVQVNYLDALRNLGEFPRSNRDEPNISKELYGLIPLMIQAFNRIDEVDYEKKRSNDQKGAVLIFLPGLYQIETLFDLLDLEDRKNPEVFSLWLCPLHSSITKEEQDKVRQYAPQGKRKIILSTNIAESSITIPDVKYVIDFCLTKHLVADPITGFTSLQLAWASHTNCIQREGRAGRVQDGRVYRLVDKDFYLFSMPKESVPEMQRCPLDIIVLKSKRLEENICPLHLIACVMDPPDLSNYEKTILKLKEIGALLTTCKGMNTDKDGDLTFFGKVMSSLPLDIHITKLILLGHIFDVLDEAIIMGSAMSVRNLFSEPFRMRLEAYNNKLLWADASESDSIAYLNAYVVWRNLTGIGKFNRSKASEDAWARKYMLQIKHLREVAKQEEDIKKRLKSFNIGSVRSASVKGLWMPTEKPIILKIVLAGAFYPHYFSRSVQNPSAETDAVRTLSGQSPFNSVYLQNMPHPAPLYLDQVKDCLRMNGVSDIMQLYSDDSRKVIVQFKQVDFPKEETVGDKRLHLDIPGEIVMPVYRAVKLRQLNIPIVINTYSASQVREELRKLSLRSRTSMLTVASTPEHKSPIKLTQQIIEIEITHVENAGHFYGHILPRDDRLINIHRLMNEKNRLRQVTGEVLEDLIYAAPYKDGDDEFMYYRAKVKRKFSTTDKEFVTVVFIDYGNTLDLLASELREMDSEKAQEELEKCPPYALHCTLAEVCPSIWSNQMGQWSDAANDYVTRIILNKSWHAEVYSCICEVASIYLFLRDNSKPSDSAPCTLNKVLVQKGYARNKEEDYFSKLNHVKRVEVQQSEQYNMESNAGCEDGIVKNLEKDLMSLPTTSGLSRVTLKGPNSPLEMKLYSMTRCSSQKEVKVEWNSVNSVLLDADPTDPHERLLVAGSVTQSVDGRRLTLNHTTALPNQNGLAALICLIFAPTIELRTDESLSQYTGALCGLGKLSNGQPLYKENDMEIIFDVEFTNEDILNVNKLRYWLNERFCNDDTEDMPDSHIIEAQNHIKEFIISLLQTRSQCHSIRVYHTPQPHIWGKLKPDHVFHPLPEANNADLSKFIYKLHEGVDINPMNGRTEIERLIRLLEKLEETLKSGLKPRQIYCDLCDAHFDYCPQLQLHMNTTYHQRLVKWLQSRANVLGLTFKKG
uniref:Probable ATP-dependent RNA helicase spindle-E n=1 Tax=Cuerna arida TaxID=1464854 RepID=A0A1B6GC48_9HEMI